MVQKIETVNQMVVIWNPYAAAFWSLLLTPAFGSFLLMKNWQEMGVIKKHKSAKYWFYGSLTILAIALVMLLMPGELVVWQFVGNAMVLAYLGAWYLMAATDQASYITEKFEKNYLRRPWGKALLLGVVGLAGYYALGFFIGFVKGHAGSA